MMALDNTIEAYRAEYPDADDLLLRAYMDSDARHQKREDEPLHELFSDEARARCAEEFWRDNKHRVWCRKCSSCERWRDPPVSAETEDLIDREGYGAIDAVLLIHGCKYQMDADGNTKITQCPKGEPRREK